MKKLSTPERHQLAIARKTLNTPDALLGVLGGMSRTDAQNIILRLTGVRVCPDCGKPTGKSTHCEGCCEECVTRRLLAL